MARNRIQVMLPLLDERQRRLYLAAEVGSVGYGGLKSVHELTGVSQTTIIGGQKELRDGKNLNGGRIRLNGGGRKGVAEKHAHIKDGIERITGSGTLGNPENALLRTTKSLRNIETALREKGISAGHDTVGNVLKETGYSLRHNQKMLPAGTPPPDRNAQFEYINRKSEGFIRQNQPVISVDTKKKELVGNFKNNGAGYRRKKNPTPVPDHDFPPKEPGKVAP